MNYKKRIEKYDSEYETYLNQGLVRNCIDWLFGIKLTRPFLIK